MKIAIIGAGGAGLLAAWLLEERHDVTLFERETRVGGHAQTWVVLPDRAQAVKLANNGEKVAASPGFHFFSRRMYPRFIRLLEHLNLPLLEYEQTCTFHDRASGRGLCLPPFGGFARIKTLFGPGAGSTLGALRKTLKAAEPLVASGGWSETFAEFIGRLALPGPFVDGFLLPFFSSNWGLFPGEILGLSARAVLSYATIHQPSGLRPCLWTEIDGGMVRYAEAMRAAASRTRFVLGGEVLAIRRAGAQWTVQTAAGDEAGFDHVIFATNAREARAALEGVAGADAARDALGGFEYFETRIAIHRDASFLPPNRRQWSVVNLAREREFCAIHHWAGWRQKAPVFRSWITHYETKPREIEGEFSYLHMKPTPGYYASQARLAHLQGREGLHFAGVYTQGFDNHESAINSAIESAARIDPGSPRARLFA